MTQKLKRYQIGIDTWTEFGGELQFSDLEIKEVNTGEWVKYAAVEAMVKKIKRYQNRIDELEGRVVK